MPFVILKPTNSVSDGTISLNQLLPNTAQRNPILDGEGRTQYLKNLDQADGVSIAQPGGAGNPQYLRTKQGANGVSGLAAYLLDNVDATANGTVGTAAQANTAVAAIIVILNNGTALNTAAVDGVLAGAFGGGTAIGAGNTTATVEEILEICAGRKYVVPGSKAISADESTKGAAAVGGFTKPSMKITAGQDFSLSLSEGELSGLESASVHKVTTSYPYRGGSSVNRGHSPVYKSTLTEVEDSDLISVYSDAGAVLD